MTEITTLNEKEAFIAMWLNNHSFITDIMLNQGCITFVDEFDQHYEFSSQKFIHTLNQSLIVINRPYYHATRKFVQEFLMQRKNVVKEKYPQAKKYIFSQGDILIQVPQEDGKTLLCQEKAKTLFKKRGKKNE